MHIELFRDENIPLALTPAAGRNLDAQLKGGSLLSHHSVLGSLFLQEYETTFCTVHYALARSYTGHKIYSREPAGGIRLIGAMKEAFRFKDDITTTVKPGQFILLASNEQTLQVVLEKGKEYRVFCTYYAAELLSALGIEPATLKLKEKPRAFTPQMSSIVYDMFTADYQPELLRFFYENKVRELLFMALAYEKNNPPPNFSSEDLDNIYAINSMITNNYTDHFSIPEISRQFGINEFKLKKGFRQIIGTGLFEKLLDTRLERAKQLLITTNMPEKEIAWLTGYSRLTSFITAFRKRTKITPRDFRIAPK